MLNLSDICLNTLLVQHRLILERTKHLAAFFQAADGDSQPTLYKIADSLVDLYERCGKAASDWNVNELAWRTRGIFELSLIAEFVCADKRNEQRFEADVELDKLDVLESLAWIDKSASQSARFEQRRIELKSLKQSLPSGQRGPMHADRIAKELGRTDEYKNEFKLYSKLSHPTAWAVLGPRMGLDWDGMIRFLLLKASGHAEQCALTLKKHRV